VITREVVEAHGGTIECEPLSPRGTRFSIRLPADTRRSAPETKAVVDVRAET
jgi:signal transduction histidine kinase